MQVVERRWEQAAEESTPRHSGAGRNPVVETRHSRFAGMAIRVGHATRPLTNPAIIDSRRPHFLDSGLRRDPQDKNQGSKIILNLLKYIHGRCL